MCKAINELFADEINELRESADKEKKRADKAEEYAGKEKKRADKAEKELKEMVLKYQNVMAENARLKAAN